MATAIRPLIVPERAERLPYQAHHDHDGHRRGEQVGGHRERPPGLADPAQVAVAHQDHDADRDQRDGRRIINGRDRGRDGRCARRHLDRDGDHVIDEQRHRRDLRHPGPEVLPRDHVRPAGPGVDRDDLAVRQHDEGHHEQDNPGERQDERERRDRQAAPEQLDQDFLGAVRRGGDPVGREHAERQPLGEALLGEFLIDQRWPEQAPLEGVPNAFRHVRGPAEQSLRLAHRHAAAPSA
jgi:hypothetical protein